MDDANPFADSSIQKAAATGSLQQPATLEDYNPFDKTKEPTVAPTPQPATGSTGASESAVLRPSSQQAPPPYTQQESTEALRKRQEELERKEAELSRREEELRSRRGVERVNNWPPLPSWFPVQPCFYQDIGVEIGPDYQRLVRFLYYTWICHAFTYLINLFAALMFFINRSQGGAVFALAIVYLVIFTPCSFVCWWRPIYKAFKNDSSFMFMVFFFIFFCQLLADGIFALGIDQLGTCGWLNSLNMWNASVPTAIAMTIVAICFSALVGIDAYLIFRVHTLYRTTGASFSKAQEEFAQGVIRSDLTRNMAAAAASNAAPGAASGNQPSGRY